MPMNLRIVRTKSDDRQLMSHCRVNHSSLTRWPSGKCAYLTKPVVFVVILEYRESRLWCLITVALSCYAWRIARTTIYSAQYTQLWAYWYVLLGRMLDGFIYFRSIQTLVWGLPLSEYITIWFGRSVPCRWERFISFCCCFLQRWGTCHRKPMVGSKKKKTVFFSPYEKLQYPCCFVFLCEVWT